MSQALKRRLAQEYGPGVFPEMFTKDGVLKDLAGGQGMKHRYEIDGTAAAGQTWKTGGENLQTVFDRTEWADLHAQMNALVRVLTDPDRLKTTDEIKNLVMLVNWLDALRSAAEMDGYQTIYPAEAGSGVPASQIEEDK